MLAAIFYLLSRYEEYLPHQKDMYGRYAHKNALAFQNDFLNQPLVNTWLEHFKRTIKQKNSQFSPARGGLNKIGLHPSWQSNDQLLLIEKEKNRLENIASKKVSASRQHYIRLSLPQTYRQLIQAGINNDYSMGYGSINGFRASITTSFYWYDLDKEEQTSLLIHPFCFMDANAFFEQKLTAEQAFNEMLSYYKTIKNVNGQMITIWHNTFLGTDRMFKGWREAYEKFIEIVSSSY
ncbi:MAG: polysaccharide deacetylase family protein [Chitinophagaceae bacterium]